MELAGKMEKVHDQVDDFAVSRVIEINDLHAAWKDLFDQAGEITGIASLTTRDDAPKLRDALCVAQFKAASMIAV